MTSFKRFESKPVVKIILIHHRLNLWRHRQFITIFYQFLHIRIEIIHGSHMYILFLPDVRFVLSSSCLFLIYVVCVCLRIMMSSTYLFFFFFCVLLAVSLECSFFLLPLRYSLTFFLTWMHSFPLIFLMFIYQNVSNS
jgi:hypothetical protein